MNSMNVAVLCTKVLLITAGVVSLAAGVRVALPLALNEIPVMWYSVVAWLKPPYLYVVMNAIIAVIIASSRFHQSQSEPSVRSEHLISVRTPPSSSYEMLLVQPKIAAALEESMAAATAVVYADEDRIAEVKPVMVNGSKVIIENGEVDVEADEALIGSVLPFDSPPEKIIYPELNSEFLLPVREKPLVSSRFGHRKPIRTTPEGSRALGVARPKRHETLESTWKMITVQRHVPLARHLKKSDASEQHQIFTADHTDHEEAPPAPATSRIRKEPSLTQDELNRRVEAFIKKFNEEMRLQREESLNQFRNMIHRP